MRHRASSQHFHKPRYNARGQHTRDPGWIAGGHWVVCDMCGCDVRNTDARETWHGLVVCPDDWEPRHEQDFVRSKEDKITPDGLVRPDQPLLFIEICTTTVGTAVSGLAIAGQMIAGNSCGRQSPATIVSDPTFNGNTL